MISINQIIGQIKVTLFIFKLEIIKGRWIVVTYSISLSTDLYVCLKLFEIPYRSVDKNRHLENDTNS